MQADRKLNYLFVFLLVVLFVFATGADIHWQMIMGFIFSFAISMAAFLLYQLTLDGMVSSIVAGTIVYGLGGLEMAVILVLFFISSSVFSTDDTRNLNLSRRNGLQVWANSIWLVITLMIFTLSGNVVFIIGGIAAIAAATADTWATELRSKKAGATYLITNLKPVLPGTDGGVSIQGTLAALAGSIVIGVAAGAIFMLGIFNLLIIIISGFLGCVVDSYLGAVYQHSGSNIELPASENTFTVGNNIVNALASGAAAVLAIVLNLILNVV